MRHYDTVDRVVLVRRRSRHVAGRHVDRALLLPMPPPLHNARPWSSGRAAVQSSRFPVHRRGDTSCHVPAVSVLPAPPPRPYAAPARRAARPHPRSRGYCSLAAVQHEDPRGRSMLPATGAAAPTGLMAAGATRLQQDCAAATGLRFVALLTVWAPAPPCGDPPAVLGDAGVRPSARISCGRQSHCHSCRS